MLQNGTPEQQAKIQEQDKNRKKARRRRNKTIPIDKLIMSTDKQDVLATRKLVTGRSTQQPTARQRSAERASSISL